MSNKLRMAIEEEFDIVYDREGVGTIRSPGKFEGEPAWAPYYWRSVMEGGADEDNGDVAIFVIGEEDREVWPELNAVSRIWLWEDEQGFVNTRQRTYRDQKKGGMRNGL